jgi:hypothetical protein
MAYIGFSTDVPVARVIALGFAFGAAMVSLAVLAIAIGGTVSFRWRMDGAMLQAAAVQMAVFPIAALHEELMFRGYPFQRLMESIGAWPAVIILSLLFAVPHSVTTRTRPSSRHSTQAASDRCWGQRISSADHLAPMGHPLGMELRARGRLRLERERIRHRRTGRRVRGGT